LKANNGILSIDGNTGTITVNMLAATIDASNRDGVLTAKQNSGTISLNEDGITGNGE
jgi:hypothetical protein